MIKDKELKLFLDGTQELGENFNFTQGAGGNTSYKSNESLFIKASGFKLKKANSENIFVEVNYKKVIENLNNLSIDPLNKTYNKNKTFKPSIETTMHALLPQKYVFHLHCLNTLSLVIQKNFENELKNLFNDLNYEIIKYAMPGISLANEIKDKLKFSTPDILFLSNHGLVVGANSVNEALEKIYYISDNIKNSFFKKNVDLNISFLDEISHNTLYRPTKFTKSNQLASCDRLINQVTRGSLFPDQVVFLGNKILIANSLDDLTKISLKFKSTSKLPILIIPKSGILVPRNISMDAEELILALYLIISKIPNDKEINYLTKSEENEIINSSAEKYRLKINNS